MKSISKRVAEIIRQLSFNMLFKADRIESLGLLIFIFSTLKNVINRILYRFRPKLNRGKLGILSTLENNTSGKSKNNIDGAIFIGYAEGALGLGQSFRSNLEAARSAKFPFAIFPVKKNIETRLIGPFMADRYDIVNGYSINIFEIAVDQLDIVKKEIDLSFKKKSYNILRPYWELSRAPEEWRKLISDFDELWAPNQYISDAFSHVFDKEIIVMPPAVDVITPYSANRRNLKLEEDKFYFLFSFDYNSSPYRKILWVL